MTRSYDAVVIGAGPAGLSAAWRMARRGLDVLVVERSERVGGMSGSFTVGGVSVDFGSHRLHPSISPEILGALRELLGAELQERRRNGRIRLQGRWVAFPLRAADMVSRLPRGFALRASVDAVVSPFRRPRRDSFAEVVRAGLGPTVGEGFYRPYARKIWGVDPEQLHGDLAHRRVSARSPVDVARRVLPGRPRTGAGFYYPKHGFGAICDCLAEAAVTAGAELRLGAELTGIDVTAGEVALDDGSSATGGVVLSTAPLGRTIRRVKPPSARLVDLLGGLEHRSVVLVYLLLAQERYTEFDAHYFPAPDVAMSRLSEPKNYRDGEDPAARTVLCAEIPCWAGDAIWEASPAEAGEIVSGALPDQGLPAVEAVEVQVKRLRDVYPVYRLNYRDHLEPVMSWVAGQDRFVTLGRQGLFVPDNTHHALAMGWEAAECVRPGLPFDKSRWERALDAFSRHVVED
ncbi:MAG: putative thiazole biosynthetic enzyme [Acidimicrobiales bacterium]|nr:putative thiazole biosynthetic enzyme [Acidimicrobiales bacterium]